MQALFFTHFSPPRWAWVVNLCWSLLGSLFRMSTQLFMFLEKWHCTHNTGKFIFSSIIMCLAKTQNFATKWEQRDAIWTWLTKTSLPPHWHFDSLCKPWFLLLLFLFQWSCHFTALFRQKSPRLSLLGKSIGLKQHPSWLKLIRISRNGKLHPFYFSSLSSECGVKTKHCSLQNLSKPPSHSFCLHSPSVNCLYRDLNTVTWR